jgi:hypothetical protein
MTGPARPDFERLLRFLDGSAPGIEAEGSAREVLGPGVGVGEKYRNQLWGRVGTRGVPGWRQTGPGRSGISGAG